MIDVGEGWGVAFKSNPTIILVQSNLLSGNGVGGVVRDIFTMGARPVLLTNSLRFGDLENEQ